MEFLGFCAKKVVSGAELWEGCAVREVASVSGCVAARPDGWIERWDFNRATCWDTEAAAWAAVPVGGESEFRIYCYRIVDETADLFPESLPDLPPEPDLKRFRRLGFDVVQRMPEHLGFGCSPLACNGTGKEIAVNEYCLVDDLAAARACLQVFGPGKTEPGPFVIVEVLARHE